jgi:hypothetical protein
MNVFIHIHVFMYVCIYTRGYACAYIHNVYMYTYDLYTQTLIYTIYIYIGTWLPLLRLRRKKEMENKDIMYVCLIGS